MRGRIVRIFPVALASNDETMPSAPRTTLKPFIFALMIVLVPISALATPKPASQAHPPSNHQTVLRLLNDAQSEISVGQLQAALNGLKLAASMEPNNPIVLVRLSIALNMSGDFSGAEALLRRAKSLGAPDDLVLGPVLEAMLALGEYQAVLDLYPDPEPANKAFSAAIILRGRAAALQALGEPTAATDAINRSLAMLHDFDGVMTAGRIALSQHDLANAESRADEALQLKPNSVDASVVKIEVAIQQGDDARARALAEQLVADEPQSLEALLARIKVYLAAGLTEMARPDVDRILAQKPDLLIARYYRAIVLARSNNPSGAWSVAHGLPAEYLQSSAEIAINVANMALSAGFLESGAAILNAVVFKYPDLVEPRLQLADVRLRQKSPRYALNTLSLIEDSTDPRVSIIFARAYLMARDQTNAQKYIDRAIALGGGEGLRTLGKDLALKSLNDWLVRHPASTLVKSQYAVLLLGFGELAKARVQYEQLVLDEPNNALSLNNLAWLIASTDPKRSLALAQRAVKQDPSSAHYLDTLGWLQLKQSDNKDALASLQQAHQRAPSDPEISYHLALALAATGARSVAIPILQAAVTRGGFSEVGSAKTLLARWLRSGDPQHKIN